jgi:RHS repeat-associated protein
VVLDHYSYTYDRAGNRTARANVLHSAFDEEYTYDSIDRLASATRADDFDQSWTLDGLGNFAEFDDDGESQTRTANGVNEITGITGGWISPSYDAAGNMISGPKPGDETTRVHYVYDAWNRLVKVYDDDSGDPGDLIAEYEYDGTNRRIEKEVTGASHAHYYFNHDWQLLEERFVDEQDELLASNQYVWSARYIDAPIIRFHDDNIRYYTADANYNVTATIDSPTAEVVDRYVYTAYGRATVYDDHWTNPAAPTTDGPLYCGYFFDAESGLYQVRNRYYDAGLSTFISRDPVSAGDDFNLYRYVGGNPIVFVDPTGQLRSSSAWGTALAETDSRASQAMDLLKKLNGWLDTIPCKCELAVSGIPSIIDTLLLPNRPNGKPQWPWQHCASNCMMVAMCGGDQQSEQCAAWLSLAKEVLDLVACVLVDHGHGDSCDSAFQPSDFQDNAAGRNLGRCCAVAGGGITSAACCAAACAPGRYNAPETPGPFGDPPGDWPTWDEIMDDLW